MTGRKPDAGDDIESKVGSLIGSRAYAEDGAPQRARRALRPHNHSRLELSSDAYLRSMQNHCQRGWCIVSGALFDGEFSLPIMLQVVLAVTRARVWRRGDGGEGSIVSKTERRHAS